MKITEAPYCDQQRQSPKLVHRETVTVTSAGLADTTLLAAPNQ